MPSITANELKTRGVSALESAIGTDGEALITVRGKDKYIVMTVEKYSRLREYELAEMVREVRADYEAGRYQIMSVAEHIKQVTDGL